MSADKLQLSFSNAEKKAILTVLDKYPVAPLHHHQVRDSVHTTGAVVLFPDEARYLAGIIRPYYNFLSMRIEAHPGLAE